MATQEAAVVNRAQRRRKLFAQSRFTNLLTEMLQKVTDGVPAELGCVLVAVFLDRVSHVGLKVVWDAECDATDSYHRSPTFVKQSLYI